MSGSPDERHPDPGHEWLIAAQPDRVVRAPASVDDGDDLDWEQTTLTMTLHGSLQSGYDLVDAIESAATFYGTLAHRDRHTNRNVANRHAELADQMSAIAADMEQQLNLVLNAGADAGDEHSQNGEDGDELDE